MGDVLRPAAEGGPRALVALPFETVVVGLAAAVLLGCLAWLVLTTAVATVLALVGDLAPRARVVALLDRVVDRWSPVLVRRLVATAVGTAVTAGLAAGPALAAPGDGNGLSGLGLPDRTTGAAAAPTPSSKSSPAWPDRVVVRPGDCLWSLAADLLPPRASDREVASAWHLLHAANRGRIGPDPDLILPGTHLVVPDLTPQREEAP